MKIKQLEWEKDAYGDFEAGGFWGMFQVVNSGDGVFTASLNDSNDYEGYEEEDFPTAEEGKAYCQSLFEQQVTAAMGFVEVCVEQPKKNKDGLFPCPFCGEYPDNDTKDYCQFGFVVRHVCKNNKTAMGTSNYKTKQEAIDAWNRRA